MARCLLIDSGLPKAYWEYAVEMAAYLRNRTPTTANRTPTTANLRNETPYEVVFGKVPNLQNLPIFGSPLEVHIPDEMRDKLRNPGPAFSSELPMGLRHLYMRT